MFILAMSFSGSVVFLAIVMCMLIGKNYLSANWIFLMLKLNLIFYCIPLPYFKYIYGDILFSILGIKFFREDLTPPIRNYILIRMDSISFNFELYIILVWLIWIAGVFYACIRYVSQYKYFKRIQKKVSAHSDYLQVFEKVKKELGVKKKVTLVCSDHAKKICTMGVFKKFIMISEKDTIHDDLYYIFKHELVHVKREDVFYKYIAILAMIVHWFNPLIYVFFYLGSVYCEKSCDAVVVCNLQRDERKKYGKLIIDMAVNNENSKYQFNFNSGKKIIEGRVKNVLHFKKMKTSVRICSLLVGSLVMFSGSLTVFAYEEPGVMYCESESKEGNQNIRKMDREFIHIEDIQFSDDENMVTKEFFGKDGSYYNITEEENNDNERIYCVHSFVNGYCKEHFRYYDNGCKTDYCYADICEKCGYIIQKGYSHTETSTTCTH